MYTAGDEGPQSRAPDSKIRISRTPKKGTVLFVEIHVQVDLLTRMQKYVFPSLLLGTTGVQAKGKNALGAVARKLTQTSELKSDTFKP